MDEIEPPAVGDFVCMILELYDAEKVEIEMDKWTHVKLSGFWQDRESYGGGLRAHDTRAF
jgi:hypothetical protein